MGRGREAQRLADELRGRCGEDQRCLHDLSEERRRGDAALGHEREVVSSLHQKVLELQEAQTLPGRLRRKSSILARFLGEDSGRHGTQRHAHALEACQKLYDEVVRHAPVLRPIAGRVWVDVERIVARWRQLEENHSQILERMHFMAAKAVMDGSAIS